MEDYTFDGSSNSTNFSLTPEQIEREEFERDFQVFMKFVTRQDLAKIYKCIGILLLEERIRADVESSASGTRELPLARQAENQQTWSFRQNADNFTWHQDDAHKIINHVLINAQQAEMLEKAFSSYQYISSKKRRSLAERVGLTENQVSCWFNNRRRRFRQEQTKTIDMANVVYAAMARRQQDQVRAHWAAVKQESFDMGYVGTSNLQTKDDISGERYSLVPTVNSENTSPDWNAAPQKFTWQED